MRGNQKNKNYKMRWTPKFAYAIGLLTTDGSLSKDGRHFDFTSKDIGLVKTFKKCVNLTNVKIGMKTSGFTEKRYPHIQFSNVRLYRELLKIGLMPNKSRIIGALKIPNKYFFDFLRGHFDGDGSCYSYWDKRWDSSFMFYVKFYLASKKHILWLRSKIKNLLDINGDLSANGKTPTYQLKYAKRESRILLSKMYYKKGLPCLKGKYKKLKNILNVDDEEISRSLESNGRVMEQVDIYA